MSLQDHTDHTTRTIKAAPRDTDTAHHAAVCGIFAARAAHRRLHAAYRCWLYRTQAWHVSFDEWKVGRDDMVEALAS